MALVNLLEDPWSVATVFFAMAYVFVLIKKGLLDFFMYGHTLEYRIEFLDLHPFRRVLLVLGGNVPGCTWHPGFLVLCALQNNLNPISFLGHYKLFTALLLLLGFDFLQYGKNPLLVDNFQPFGRNVQADPTILFGNVEFLFGNVDIEPSLGLIDGKGNIVSEHHLLSCNFTNFGHLP